MPKRREVEPLGKTRVTDQTILFGTERFPGLGFSALKPGKVTDLLLEALDFSS